MRPEEQDLAYLWDIREAARDILTKVDRIWNAATVSVLELVNGLQPLIPEE
jgi:hypothetical protein